MKAEADGYVTLSIQIEEEGRLVEDLVRFICNDYSNELAGQWNQARKEIAEYAAHNILFPQTVRWLKEKLSITASEYVALKCQAALEQVFLLLDY